MYIYIIKYSVGNLVWIMITPKRGHFFIILSEISSVIYDKWLFRHLISCEICIRFIHVAKSLKLNISLI